MSLVTPASRPPRRHRATLPGMPPKKPEKPARGPGNPTDSQWYSTPKAQRLSKTRTLTLTDETWDGLGALAETAGESKSAWVARKVAEEKAAEPVKKKK